MDILDPVGLAEISELLGVPPNTVTSWRQRGQLPKPSWQLKAGPIWLAEDIRHLYEQERNSSAIATDPDQIAEAIDLSAEPGRAEVYAHYGLAMGEAQLVEHHLATVLALIGIPAPYEREIFFKIIEEAESKTMGKLKDLLRDTGVPVLGIDHLQRIVNTRNLLAHRIRDPERSVKMTTDSGRQYLIHELDAAAREFHITAQHLQSTEIRLALGHGVSKHDVIHRAQELISGATPDSPISQRAAVFATGDPNGLLMAVVNRFPPPPMNVDILLRAPAAGSLVRLSNADVPMPDEQTITSRLATVVNNPLTQSVLAASTGVLAVVFPPAAVALGGTHATVGAAVAAHTNRQTDDLIAKLRERLERLEAELLAHGALAEVLNGI